MVTKQNWTIGIVNSGADGVIILHVYGTKQQVIKHLVSLVKEDRKTDKEKWDTGTEQIKDVVEISLGHLYAYGNYEEYHIDYTASIDTLPIKL